MPDFTSLLIPNILFIQSFHRSGNISSQHLASDLPRISKPLPPTSLRIWIGILQVSPQNHLSLISCTRPLLAPVPVTVSLAGCSLTTNHKSHFLSLTSG